MVSQCRFQTLPMPIVEMVVEYLEERARNSLHGAIDIHNQKKIVITPLLLVSERWRMAALASICDNCSLIFNNSTKGYEVIYHTWPSNFSLPGFNRDRLVKRVVVLAPSWDQICSGAFSSIFTGPIYECAMFPTAPSLMIFLNEADSSGPIRNAHGRSSVPSLASTVRDTAVAGFARSLLKLAPLAASISMYFCSPGATNQQNKGLCNVLVSELCHGSVSRVEMDSAPGCSLPSFQIQGAPGLTGLIQGLGQVCAPFSRIAYLNASTLKELIIRPTTDAEWRTVIYGDSKTPAVYTSLTLITLVTEDVPLGVKWTAIKGVTPFPVLIHLGIVGAYPFDDDNSLYRGNGRSLKCLHLPFGVVSRNILGKYSILNRSGVAQMDTIVFGRVIDMDNNPVAGRANAIIKQQVDRMLEVTRQLSLANDTADMQVFNAIKTAPRTAIIQHLSFSILPLDIDMLFDIVSALPSLITLACRLKKSVPSVKSLPLNKQPNILHGRYYPLSSNFKRLDIVDDENISAKKAAAVAMQLAVICPNFAFVDAPRDIRKVIRREIAWAMANQPFKPYADALRRLI